MDTQGFGTPPRVLRYNGSYLVHYFSGKLTKAALRVAAAKITISAVSRVPGSTGLLAAGWTHAAGNLSANVVAVVLRYS
jgi:hypothetical protein